MANSLVPIAPPALIPTPPKKNTHLSCLCFHRTSAEGPGEKLLTRRSVALGLGGAFLGLNAAGERSADAAGRRAALTTTPEEEKKDPNVSGLMAKVLASKRRKDAMKESMAKLREKGKIVVNNESSQ